MPPIRSIHRAHRSPRTASGSPHRAAAHPAHGAGPDSPQRAAEQRFRALLAAAGLDPPDRVTDGPDSVTFFWDGPKVAVVVDLDDAAEGPARGAAGAA